MVSVGFQSWHHLAGEGEVQVRSAGVSHSAQDLEGFKYQNERLLLQILSY